MLALVHLVDPVAGLRWRACTWLCVSVTLANHGDGVISVARAMKASEVGPLT